VTFRHTLDYDSKVGTHCLDMWQDEVKKRTVIFFEFSSYSKGE